MKMRCDNPKTVGFEHYGGRGISICSEWRDFENFLADMGERPPGMTLDRIDVNGNYCKENCRWASPQTQSNNTRRNVLITKDGVTLTLFQWARKLGISEKTVSERHRQGMPVEKILSPTPLARERSGPPCRITISYKGQKRTIGSIAKEKGVPTYVIRNRIRNMSIEQAVALPYPLRKRRPPSAQ